MSGNFAIMGGGGGGPLMANAILNFHFDFLTTSLNEILCFTHVSILSDSEFIVDDLPTMQWQLGHRCVTSWVFKYGHYGLLVYRPFYHFVCH